MIFRQLFEPVSSTYTYLLACETTGQAMLIDPVINAIDRDLQMLRSLRLTLALLRTDYRVCGSFAPRTAVPLPLPVHAFAGRDDPIGLQPMQAWSAETSEAFTLDGFDGGHFFIRSAENAFLAALAQRLGQIGAGARLALQEPA